VEDVKKGLTAKERSNFMIKELRKRIDSYFEINIK